MNVNLVTGASGILGIQVTLALARRGEKVLAMYTSEESLTWSKKILDFEGVSVEESSLIQWRKAELNDADALEELVRDCHIVFHCAAVVSYRSDERKRMYTANVDGTRLLVNLCLDKPGIKFCHVSSIAAIGRATGVTHLDEESEWVDSPHNTHYAISKYLGELEVWRAIHEGLSAFIVCPGFIIGPGRPDRSSSTVIPSVALNLGIFPPGGTAFIAAKDCACQMIQLMNARIEGERFILAECNMSHQEFFTKIAKALSLKIPGKQARQGLLLAAVIFSRLREWLGGTKNQVTLESIRNASVRYFYDNAKVGRIVKSTGYNIDSAIQESVRFYSRFQ